jgi:hypothetical protein
MTKQTHFEQTKQNPVKRINMQNKPNYPRFQPKNTARPKNKSIYPVNPVNPA